MTLEEIIAETKISRRILESLESGKFHFLPEMVFSKNFVRQYVRIVGGDEEAMLAKFESAWEQFRIASGSHSISLTTEAPKPVIRWHFWIPITVAVCILVVVAAIIYLAPKDPAEVMPDPRRPSAGWRTEADTVVPSPVPQAETDLAPEEEAASGFVSMTVEVAEAMECWVHYRDREGRTAQQTLTDGASLELELAGPVMLKLGNAGAVSVTVGERRFEKLGPLGQVVHAEVGRDGLIRIGSRTVYE